jgi:hypothetical protein
MPVHTVEPVGVLVTKEPIRPNHNEETPSRVPTDGQELVRNELDVHPEARPTFSSASSKLPNEICIVSTWRNLQEDNEDDDDDGTPTPKIHTKIPPSYEWSHFFRGYIDKKWVENQEKFHRDLGHDKQKFTGKQWATKLIRF